MDVFSNVLEGTRQYFMGLPKPVGDGAWQEEPAPAQSGAPTPSAPPPSAAAAPPPRPPSEPLEPEPHIIHKATVMREAAEKRREREDDDEGAALSPPPHIIRRPEPAPHALPPAPAPQPEPPRGATPVARPPEHFTPARPPDPYSSSRPPEPYPQRYYETDASRSVALPSPQPPRHGSPQTYARLSSSAPAHGARLRDAAAPSPPAPRYSAPPPHNDRVPPIHHPQPALQRLPDARYQTLQHRTPSPYSRALHYDRHPPLPQRKYDPQQAYPGYRPSPPAPQPVHHPHRIDSHHNVQYKHAAVEAMSPHYPARPVPERVPAPTHAYPPHPHDSRQPHEARRPEYPALARPAAETRIGYHYPTPSTSTARYVPPASNAAAPAVPSSTLPPRPVHRPAAAPKSNCEYPTLNHVPTSPARSTVKSSYPNQQPRMTVSVTTLVNQMNQTKQKRESPLDLSVKTVKNSADSSTTQDDMIDSASMETKAVPLHPRPLSSSSSSRHSAGVPGYAESHKVDFAPDFTQYRERTPNHAYPPAAPPGHHPVRYNGSYETPRPAAEPYPVESRHTYPDRNKYSVPVGRADYVPQIDLTRPVVDERRPDNRIRDDRHFIIEERKRPSGPIVSNIPEKIMRYETWSADSRIDRVGHSAAREQQELMSQPVYSYSSHKQFEAYQIAQKRLAASSAYREHHAHTQGHGNHRYPYPEQPAPPRDRHDYHAHHHDRNPSTNNRHVIQKIPSHRDIHPHRIDPHSGIPADKTVLSILRNSLETKQGFVEPARPPRQIPDLIVIDDVDDSVIEITDLTKENDVEVPSKVNPKETVTNTGHHIQMPKAVDSILTDYQRQDNTDSKSSPENDVASRIRTKAELKGLPPSESSLRPDLKPDGLGKAKIVPKSQKQHLFNQIREDQRLESVIKSEKFSEMAIPGVKSEPMNIDEIEKDAVISASDDKIATVLGPEPKSLTPESDDFDWATACDSFMEQLKTGVHKKKTSRKRTDTTDRELESNCDKIPKREPVDSTSKKDEGSMQITEPIKFVEPPVVIKQEPPDEIEIKDLIEPSSSTSLPSEKDIHKKTESTVVVPITTVESTPRKEKSGKKRSRKAPETEDIKEKEDKSKSKPEGSVKKEQDKVEKSLTESPEKRKNKKSVKENSPEKPKGRPKKSLKDEKPETPENEKAKFKESLQDEKSETSGKDKGKLKKPLKNEKSETPDKEKIKPKRSLQDVKLKSQNKVKKSQPLQNEVKTDRVKASNTSIAEENEMLPERNKETSISLETKDTDKDKSKSQKVIQATSEKETKQDKKLTTKGESNKLLRKNAKLNDKSTKDKSFHKTNTRLEKRDSSATSAVTIKKEIEDDNQVKVTIKQEPESSDEDEPLIKSKIMKEKEMKYQLLKDLSEKSAYVKLECFDVDLNKNTRISIDSLTKDKDEKQSKSKMTRQMSKIKDRAENIKSEVLNDGSSSTSDEDVLSVATRLRVRKNVKTEDSKSTLNVAKTPVKGSPKKHDNSTPINSASSTPVQKPGFGDGSDFHPGWEEELYKYKRSLRMPTRLIAIPRGRSGGPFVRGSSSAFTRGSTSLPDLDPAPLSPAPSSAPSAATDLDLFARRQDKLTLDSDLESNSSYSANNRLHYDSEASSSTVLSTTARKKGSSIVDVLIQRCGKREETRKKLKDKDKEDKTPKIIPKSSNPNELLPTPSLGLVKNGNRGSLSAKKEKLMEDIFYLGAFRKETVTAFRNAFINNTNGLIGATEEFAPVVLKSRTRTESRVMKQRATIKEVFGDERPASAPPSSYREEEVVQEPEVEPVTQIKKEKDGESKIKLKPKNILKDKFRRSSSIRDGLRSTKSLKRNDAKGRLMRLKKRNSLMKSLANKRMKGLANKIKKEKPDDSVDDGEKPKEEGSTPSTVEEGTKRRFKRLFGRRKFSSGFDYIRKKKKIIRRDDTPNNKIRRPAVKPSPESVHDIQKEIKGWFINKSIGETHLHRAARLGYTDCVAYCLEKMEADPSARDNAGFTPLHVAAAKGHVRIARLLLQYGANVSAAANGGIRPLHEACENCHVEVIRLLLSYGADPLLGTYAGQTPEELTEGPAAVWLRLHISDVQGHAFEPWRFPPPAEIIDREELGCDPLSSPPPGSPPPPPDSTIEMQCTEVPLPPFYTLRTATGQPAEGLWCLLQDVTNLLQIKSKESLLKQIHCGSGSPKELLREIRTQEFLERAQCHQLLCAGEKVNVRASKVALVRVTDKLRQLLKIETVLIS